MSVLTEDQAFAAMFYFLEKVYERSQWDFLGGLLGDMSLLKDGTTADPAIAVEWHEAVEYASKGGKAGSLVLG